MSDDKVRDVDRCVHDYRKSMNEDCCTGEDSDPGAPMTSGAEQ